MNKQVSNNSKLFIIQEYLTADLITFYNSSVRTYHTLLHALQVAMIAKDLLIKHDHTPSYKNIMDVYIAGLWHDAVYVAGSVVNETESATALLKFYPDRHESAEMIRRTTVQHHLSDDDYPIELCCLLDADLDSLSSDYETFVQNNYLIQLELKTTPLESAVFLNKFLEKKSIYRTEEYKKSREQIAQSNIQRFIKENTL
jgi:predicted metal-dependent HD superfamily phosphohydrolase